MSKKVIVVSASPRRNGNSDILCGEFIRGAEEAGNYAEKIFLKDKKIGYCTACDGCRKNGGTCVQKDDMEEILNKIIDADVIVLATPVYFYSMDAQLKAMIDRTYPRYTEISGKELYFIMTAADNSKSNLEATLAGLRGFASCLPGAREKSVIYGTGAWKAGDIKTSEAVEQAYNAGKNI